MHINHFLIDFNSIIHVSGQTVLNDINAFLKLLLKNLYHHLSLNTPELTNYFAKYEMKFVQERINQKFRTGIHYQSIS
jgi:hypothetical protein